MSRVTNSLAMSSADSLNLIPGTGYLSFDSVNSLGNVDSLPNALRSALEKALLPCFDSPHPSLGF